MQGMREVELSLVGKPTWHLLSLPPTVLTFLLASLNGSYRNVVETSRKVVTN